MNEVLKIEELRRLLIFVYGFAKDFVKSLSNKRIMERFSIISDAKERLIQAAINCNCFKYETGEHDALVTGNKKFFFRPIREPKLPENATVIQTRAYNMAKEKYDIATKGFEVLRIQDLKKHIMEMIVTKVDNPDLARIKYLADGSETLCGNVGGEEKEFPWWFSPSYNMTIAYLGRVFPQEIEMAEALEDYSKAFWVSANTLKQAGMDTRDDFRFDLTVKGFFDKKKMDSEDCSELRNTELTVLNAIMHNYRKKGSWDDSYNVEQELLETIGEQELFKSVTCWLSMAYAYIADTDGTEINPFNREKVSIPGETKRFVRGGSAYNEFIDTVLKDRNTAYKNAIASLVGNKYIKADKTNGEFTKDLLAYWLFDYYDMEVLDLDFYIELMTFNDDSNEAMDKAMKLVEKAEYVCKLSQEKKAEKPSAPEKRNNGPSWLDDCPSFR